MADDQKKRDRLIQDQLKFLAEAISNQKVMINSLHSQQSEINNVRKKFPIVNDEKLHELNRDILPGNRKDYIAAIQGILRPHGIKKHLRSLLSEDVTHEYNIDGVHGKKSLKAFSNFYSVLIESITCTGEINPEEELRKAIQLQKKRHFKNMSAKNSTAIEKKLIDC